jgi:Ser/Thr protein kinase RdoA (MazF antagonist)
MSQRPFPLNNSILSAQALAQRVLSRYALSGAVRCYFLNPGLNDTYAVTAGSANYILRVYRHGWRTKAQIQAELEMLTFLRQHKLPVSYPIKRKDDSFLTRIAAPEGVRYAALFTHAPGQPIELNRTNSRSYGELLARIHVCLDQRDEDPRRFHLDLGYLVDDSLGHVTPHLQHRRDDLDFLVNVGTELKSSLQGLLPLTRPEYGCCHGDHYGGNVHVDERGGMTVFDFDCYGYGWRAYDLAVFLAKNTQVEGTSRAGRARSSALWNSFLKGYSNVRQPSELELRSVHLFVLARLIWRSGTEAQVEDWGRAWVVDGTLDRDIAFIKYWMKQHRYVSGHE